MLTLRHVKQRGTLIAGQKISIRQTTPNRFILSRNVEKTRKILRIRHREATWRLEPTSRTRNFKTETPVRMKLGGLVVLLADYLRLQTEPEYALPSLRYTWPKMALYAYPPHMVSM